MYDYIYQIQKRSHGKWIPCFVYKARHPHESKDLCSLRDYALSLSSSHAGLRIVKIETSVIETLSDY